MSDGEEINVCGLRLRKDRVSSHRVYQTQIGRMAEVRFLLDDDDGHDETEEVPQEIET